MLSKLFLISSARRTQPNKSCFATTMSMN